MRSFMLFGTMIFLNLPLKAILPERIESLVATNNYEQALPLLEALAAEGNSEAQNKMGEIYHFGYTGLVDYSKAKEWYLKAVENKSGLAANHLGRIYTNGKGVKPDKQIATYWYKKGGALGNLTAEINYYRSTGNPFYYVLDKANRGETEACFVASQFYKSGGMGITKDDKKAIEYHKKAMQLGYKIK